LFHIYKIIINKQLFDHSTLVLQLACSSEEEKQTLNKSSVYFTDILNHKIFHGDDKDWFRYMLSISRIYWDSQIEAQSIVQKVDNLSKTLEGIINQCFPTWDAGVKKGNKIPWQVRKLLSEQSKFSRKLLQSRDAAAIIKYQNILISIKLELSNSLRNKNLPKEKLIISKIKQDPKSFYSYARSFQKTKQSVGPLLNGNVLCKDKIPMANMCGWTKLWEFTNLKLTPKMGKMCNNLFCHVTYSWLLICLKKKYCLLIGQNSLTGQCGSSTQRIYNFLKMPISQHPIELLSPWAAAQCYHICVHTWHGWWENWCTLICSDNK
jgi:hypothetical protein